MADITTTASAVKPKSTSMSYQTITLGETATQGMPVYLNTSDNEYYKTKADDSTKIQAAGILLTAGGDGDPATIVPSGLIDLGATLVVGETYVISPTSGGIMPIGDLTTGDYVTVLGTATAADTLDLSIKVTSTQRA